MSSGTRRATGFADSPVGCLLGGASWGAFLLALETPIVAWFDERWATLGHSALAGALVGALAGAISGLLLFAIFRRGEDRSAFSRVFPWLAAGSIAFVLLVQIQQRWGAPLPSWGPFAVGLGLLGAVILVVLALGSMLGAGGEALFVRSPLRPLVVLALVLAGAWSLPALARAPARADLRLFATTGGAETRAAAAERGTRRLLLVGIDAARWSVLQPLLDAGKMPNLAALLERGIHGTLLSSGEEGISPVAWTTLMTGQTPEVHGVTGWAEASSSRRRVKAIWNILHDFGWKVNVVGVVASYPAEAIGGGMLAGAPEPGSILNYRGWLVTTERQVWRRGPRIRILEPAASPGGWRRVPLGPVLSPTVFQGTTVHRLAAQLSRRSARRLTRLVGPSVEIEVAFPAAADGGRRLAVRRAGDRDALVAVDEGDWSPWIEVELGRVTYRTKIRVLSADPERPSLYLTALHRAPTPGGSTPAELLPRLEQQLGPLPLETVGWTVAQDPRLLRPLIEYSMELARRKVDASLRLMDGAPWDASIHVSTVTDRIQHAYWRFREPEAYLRDLDALPDDSPLARRFSQADLEVVAEFAEEFGGTIDLFYEESDVWLGELLERARPSTLVAVISDHGGEGGVNPVVPWAGKHHPDGIYLLAGPTVPPGEAGVASRLGPTIDQQDLVPLLLAHLGLPLAADLAGTVPDELLPRGADGSPLALPEAVATYETEPRPVEVSPEASDTQELLRSLGYVQ